jgi:hypothetical protein
VTQTNPKSHRRGGAAAENVQGDEQEWDRKQHFPPIQPLKVKCKVRQVGQSINTAIVKRRLTIERISSATYTIQTLLDIFL